MGAVAAAEPSQAPARVWTKVKSQDELAPGLHRLTLTAPEIAQKAQPGQFVMLRVRHGADPLLARPFSVHGVEGDDVVILYRVVGRGTSVLRLARPGKSLFMWGPLGRGFDLSVENPVLVSGGMGRAPLAFAARKLEESGKSVDWVHGAPGKEEVESLLIELKARLATAAEIHYQARFRAFAALKKQQGASSSAPQQGTNVSVATEDGSAGTRGLVTDLLKLQLKEKPPLFPLSILACGPLPMLKAVAKLAAKHGAACQVSLEAPMACGIGVCLGCALPAAGGGYVRVCQEGPVMDANKVDWGAM